MKFLDDDYTPGKLFIKMRHNCLYSMHCNNSAKILYCSVPYLWSCDSIYLLNVDNQCSMVHSQSMQFISTIKIW